MGSGYPCNCRVCASGGVHRNQLLQQIISRAPVGEFFVPAPVVIAATASASHGGPDAVPRSDVMQQELEHQRELMEQMQQIAAADATDAAPGVAGA